jgi:hypothetical protein
MMYFANCLFIHVRRWPRGLRRRSEADRLMRLRVRIPQGHGCLSVVTVVCCQVEVFVTSWPLVQRSPTECSASLCAIVNDRTLAHWGLLRQEQTNKALSILVQFTLKGTAIPLQA